MPPNRNHTTKWICQIIVSSLFFCLVAQELHLFWRVSLPKPEERSGFLVKNTTDSTSLEPPYARVWKQRAYEDWCRNSSSSLLLVKVPKSASSTIAGSMLHLASNRCSVSWEHKEASSHYRLKDQSLLVAPIRLAHSRALSSVYFHDISFHRRHYSGTIPSDAFVQSKLHRVQDNSILRYVTFQAWNVSTIEQHVDNVLRTYDFLIIVERMAESLVVLSWLVQRPIQDFVTVSTKTSGSWYMTNQKCIELVKPVTTTALARYFDSTSWNERHAGDYMLYKAANQSLDRTIAVIGPAVVAQGVLKLQAMEQRVATMCVNETIMPCSVNGTPQLERSTCYVRDFGCGHACVRRVLTDWNG